MASRCPVVNSIRRKDRTGPALGRPRDIIEGFPISSPAIFLWCRKFKVIRHATVLWSEPRAVQKTSNRRRRVEAGSPAPVSTPASALRLTYPRQIQFHPGRSWERAIQCVKWARNLVDDVEFYAEDAGRTSNEQTRRVVAVIRAGATVVNIPIQPATACPPIRRKIAYPHQQRSQYR